MALQAGATAAVVRRDEPIDGRAELMLCNILPPFSGLFANTCLTRAAVRSLYDLLANHESRLRPASKTSAAWFFTFTLRQTRAIRP